MKRRKKQKRRLIERHGNTYVINLKWTLRLLGGFVFLASVGTLLMAALRPLPGVAIHSSAQGVSSAVVILLLADFCED